MKNIILASIFALGFSAFAHEGEDAAPKVEKVKHEKVVKSGKHGKKEEKKSVEVKKEEGAE